MSSISSAIMNDEDLFNKAEQYWLDNLSSDITRICFPYDYKRSALNTRSIKKTEFVLPDAVCGKLTRLSGNSDVKLHMALLASVYVLLYRYTGNEDLIVGMPIYRQNVEGEFLNTVLALRSSITGRMSFKELLINVRKIVTVAVENQNYPLEKLLHRLDLKPDEYGFPLFDVTVLLDNIHDKRYLEHINANTGFTFVRNETAIAGTLEYNAQFFRKTTIDNVVKHYLNILEAALGNVDLPLCELAVMSEAEKKQVLYGFNDTGTELFPGMTIHKMFEEQAEKTPGNSAVVCGGRQLTYGELNGKSNRLAGLLREKGVKPGSITAIMAERSPEMIIGILGILKAGGAYLPIDTGYPPERIKFMLEDSAVKIILTQAGLAEKINSKDLEIVDPGNNEFHSDEAANPGVINKATDLAYIIYTSGTTGQPKGVMIEHGSIAARIQWRRSEYRLGIKDTVLQLFSCSFDGFLTSFFTPIVSGSKVVLLPENESKDAAAIKETIIRQQISHFICVPSLYGAILELAKPGEFRAVRIVTLAGEMLSDSLVKKSKSINPQAEIVNEYGPTECTVVATVSRNIEPGNKITIGKPIANTQVYIVGKYNSLNPVGIPGELCIGGDGLARGYLHRPGLTSEKFVDNPYIPGRRMYRTGDLAQWLSDGNIEFLGRADHQVKIRGFRIETGEIESQLLKHREIREAVVIAREDKEGNKCLCAYISAARRLTTAELGDYLAAALPDYMIPAYFVQVDKLPRTTNGKVDRKALPAPGRNTGTGVEYQAPANATEEKLVSIWQEILDVEKAGINDNFFKNGGDSLKITVLVTRIHRELNIQIPFKEVFTRPTIRDIAAYIQESAGCTYTSIETAQKQEYYPLSSAQKRLFVLYRLEGLNITYNMPGVNEIEGELDREKIEKIFKTIIGRHETLRTAFDMIDNTPVQKVNESVEFKIEYREAAAGQVKELVESFVRPFDLSIAPLLRVALIKTGNDRHIMLFDMHHIISDGLSMGILIKEFADLYAGKEIPGLRIQYKDYSEWQKKRLQGERIKQEEAYWIDRFNGEIPVLNLPYDYARPVVQSFEGAVVGFKIGRETVQKLQEVLKENGATLFMGLLSLFNILLMKYSGQEDIVVGSPIAGRGHADLNCMIGMFVNTLAMRNKPEGNKRYMDFLKEVKENALNAYDNQDYQFEDLVEKVVSGRDLGRNPVFDAMFILQDPGMSEVEITGIKFKPYGIAHTISKFDMTMYAVEGKDSVDLSIEYCTRLFKQETIERMAEHFKNILEAVLNEPGAGLCDIQMLTEEEKHRIIYDFNDTAANYPQANTIHRLFEEQAERTPGNTAVVCEGKQLTYGELNEKSNRLAGLLREKGVKPGSIVGIMAARSPGMITGIMGILKAGGAYLPIDPGYPADRIKYMLEDSGTSLLLTQGRLKACFGTGGETIDLDDNGIYTGESTNPVQVNRQEDPAYVIYTSGSTGKPKGVMLEHRAVNNFIKGIAEKIEFTAGKTILAVTTIAFDIFVLETLVPLATGMRIIMANEEEQRDPAALGRLIKENKIDMVQTTPSRMKMIIGNGEGLAYFEPVKEIMLGGEVFPGSLLAVLNRLKNTKIYNMYGPTETTVWSVVKEVTRCTEISLGTPIANTQVYILDPKANIQPIGVPGELCISGAGLARGYLHRPELTAGKFTDNPFLPGTKMYRTGDLARWLPDGSIEFIGRMDHQVKIRGHRIEPGEIEAQLLTHRVIKEAVVTAQEDRDGSKYLAAYIVAEKEMTTQELRAHMAKALPEYMLPSCFVQLDKLPLTPNGKLDRKALPAPDGSVSSEVEYEAPANAVEEKLVHIWQEILGVKRVGINDNFFELGGHSLKAMTLVSKIHAEMDIVLPLREVFSRRTVKNLAECLKDSVRSMYSNIQSAVKRQYYPLSSAQKRMFITNKVEGSNTSYNITKILKIDGPLDTRRFEDTLNILVNRHEALRTSFEMVNDEPMQFIHDNLKFKMEFREISENIMESIIRDFIRPFNMHQAPLIRIKLLRLAVNKYVLLLDMHHIISDGFSIGVLVQDFTRIYSGQELPAMRIQYKDFAVWQNEMISNGSFNRQRDYWLQRFAGGIRKVNIPKDYPVAAGTDYSGDFIDIEIDKALYEKIRHIAKDTETTTYMILLAVFNVLVSIYSGQSDIVMGSPIAGRPHSDVNGIVGMFVNMLVMRNFPARHKTFREFLDEVKQNCLDAFGNQDYQLEILINDLGLQRSTGRNPAFDIVFAMDVTDATDLRMAGMEISYIPYENKMTRFDLQLSFAEIGGKIFLRMEYAAACFKKESIERMLVRYLEIAGQVTDNLEILLSAITISNDLSAAGTGVFGSDIADFGF